mgnify:CR=1 FL=1
MTQVDRTTFKSTTTTLFADNSTGDIGANDLRTQMNNIADSTVFRKTERIAPPTNNDDGVGTNGNGRFNVSDIWIDETNDKAYICLDSATANAVWTEVTYVDAGSISAIDGPQPDEVAFFASPTQLGSSGGLLLWNGTDFTVTGNIVVSGTVDGRDIAVDGAKLDLLPASSLSAVTATSLSVDDVTTSTGQITSITTRTGDGLAATYAGDAMTLRVDNNRITKDTTARTLSDTDNGRFITNAGAGAPVTWTIPLSTTLQATPRLVATFFKVANQTMNIVGITGVSVNGIAESGGNESIIEICPVPYDSFAVVLYAGVPNTYYVYQGTDIKKLNTVANTELAFWTADGTIDGAPEMLWDGTALDVTGEVKSNWAFNPQTGTAYTAALTDRGRIVTMSNAAANVFTIPDDTTVNFPVGTEIRVLQIGAGATSITASGVGGGVTLNGILAGSGALTGQWDEVRLYKVGADAWYATGEIGAVA